MKRNSSPFALCAWLVSPFALRALLLVALCSFPLAAFAQSATATVSGTVEDQNGATVPGVSITIQNKATSLERQATTNESGYFTIPLLSPGTYTISARHEGFTTAEIRDVVLNVGDQKAFQIQLKTGNINETVNVTAESPLISESPAVGTIVDRQFAANIPLNGRSFQSLITLTPGVVSVPTGTTNTGGQFSVNGQRASANNFTLDGVSANFGASPAGFGGPQTSGNLPGLTTLGTTQSLVSVDALEEFKVQTSSYAAEYGRQPGGQISMVTRSGGNQFHGSVFEYLRNDVLDANDWFANRAGQPRPKERQNDFGGTFSGPVLLPGYQGRNRTFFFFSYEGLRLQQPNFALTNVPSSTLRQQAPAGVQPVLNAFPLPNGKTLSNGLAEFSASYSDPSRLNATGIRVDHTLGSRVTLFGRYSGAPSESIIRLGGNLSLLQASNLNTKAFTAGATMSMTPRLNNEFRINYTNNRSLVALSHDNFGGAVPPPRGALIPGQYDSSTAATTVSLLLTGLTATATPVVRLLDDTETSQRQFNVVDSISFATGPHQLKFGVDFRRLTPVGVFPSYSLSPTFRSQQEVLAATAQNGAIVSSLPVNLVFTNFSAYGQDIWRVTPRLTLEFGLRWEVNPAPSEAHGLQALTLSQIDNFSTMQLGLGDKAWKTTYDNFAPRFGIAYQLRQAPGRETVLRGGFGVFYDTGNDTSSVPFGQYPYATARIVTNVSYPLSVSQVAPPTVPVPLTKPYAGVIAFDPQLKLPYTVGWNFAVEQSLGKDQALTMSYVGAAGRRLLQRSLFNLAAINQSFTSLFLTRNVATSDYDALQAQFRRRLSRGLQALVSYTWSHALDEDSDSNASRVAQRGNAIFDIRQLFSAAVTYDLPQPGDGPAAQTVLGGWSLDTSIHAQSALPVDIVAATLTNPVDGSFVNVRPNIISDVPWYLNGSQFPGGRIINNSVPTAAQLAAAGCSPTGAAKGAFCTPLTGRSGNLGRNQLRGLGAWQVDFALRRQFKLSEKVNLQFRAEAFNLFNHPNFGTIQTTLSAANFGQATNMLGRQLGGLNALYQVGGPRSFQFALKLGF